MYQIYQIGIHLYSALIHVVSLWSNRADEFVQGRRGLIEKVKEDRDKLKKKVIWMHCASLGEFEQGRSVLEAIHEKHPKYNLIVTFFSPSGYRVRHNYKYAEQVYYLPLDTKKNAKKFLEALRPDVALFVKYEFWPNYMQQMAEMQIPLYFISLKLSKAHWLGAWWAKSFRETFLKASTHLFAQDEETESVLKEMGCEKLTLAGDTRFDRVLQVKNNAKKIDELDRFCAGKDPVLVGGSSWKEDEEIIAAWLKKNKDWKVVLAPHEVNPQRIKEMEALFSFTSCRKLSESNAHDWRDSRVMIVDSIGKLSRIYTYGNAAFIGGGFGKGIHNTLEAAVYGIPVFFGPEHQKFTEAKELIAKKAAFTIQSSNDLERYLWKEMDSEFLIKAGKKAAKYVKNRAGATDIILEELKSTGIIGNKIV